jgi:hypothetical protein
MKPKFDNWLSFDLRIFRIELLQKQFDVQIVYIDDNH